MMSSISEKTGLPPGSLVHIGEETDLKVSVTILDYDEEKVQEISVDQIEECGPFKDRPTVTWINVDGVHNIDLIEGIGRQYDLHPLLLEDILNTEHRPKAQEFDNYAFFTFKILMHDEEQEGIVSEQVSIVFGQNWVISFQEKPEDVFDPVRERIKSGKGRLRRRGADYLVYVLIDTVVDNYFTVVERLDGQIESLENAVLSEADDDTPTIIQQLKKKLILLRKSIMPLRDAVGYLEKGESEWVDPSTTKYLRDVYDHIIHILDSLDTYRDVLTSLMDSFASHLSNRMNQVMKLLTIIATIFIPLTFIAGIYGMNFQYMPELGWKWAYPAIWALIIVIFTGMMIFFRRRKWI